MAAAAGAVGNLPVGYRFRPTDEELINHYLRLKINGFEKDDSIIREVDICKCEPWDLPDMSLVHSYDNEWFFFCPKDRKYQNSQRSNRATLAGYWKATGKDRFIKSARGVNVIGKKKTLVFYTGRAPKGRRSHWVIHEYCATDEALNGTHPGQSSFVLCRLFKKHDGKQDEMGESSNYVEVEQNTPSSGLLKSSPKDTLSEQETPMSSRQPGGYETNPETPLTIDQHSYQANSCIGEEAEGQLLDMISTQPNPDLENALGDSNEVPAYDSNLFSQCPMQMTEDFYQGSTLFGDGSSGDMDNGEFVDSILAGSDESPWNILADLPTSAPDNESPKYINCIEMVFPKDSGKCSESYVDQVDGQNNTNFLQGVYIDHLSLDVGEYLNDGFMKEAQIRSLGEGEAPEYRIEKVQKQSMSSSVSSNNGNRLRSQQPAIQKSAQNFLLHGTAQGGICLQMKLQVGENYGNISKDLDESTGVPLAVEDKDTVELHTSASDTDSGTDGASDAVLTTDESSEDHDKDEEDSQELGLNVKPKGGLPTEIKAPSFFSKAPTVLSLIPSALQIHKRLVVTGVVLAAVATLWGCFVS